MTHDDTYGHRGKEMTLQMQLEVVRLQAAASANSADAQVWRWYADLMEDERVKCIKTRSGWVIEIDGVCAIDDCSFDCAVRRACDAFAGITRSQAVASPRRRRRPVAAAR
jgi:hypothetical protein